MGNHGLSVIELVGEVLTAFWAGDRVLISCISSCAKREYCRCGRYSLHNRRLDSARGSWPGLIEQGYRGIALRAPAALCALLSMMDEEPVRQSALGRGGVWSN